MRQILQKYTPAYSKQPGFQEIGTPLHQVGGIFYLGEYNEWEPDYDNPIWDLNEWQKVQAHIKSAGVDPDRNRLRHGWNNARILFLRKGNPVGR